MLRVNRSLKCDILFVILIQALCLSVISAQKKNTFELKQEEYLKILEQNSNLKLDTTALSHKLCRLLSDNEDLIKRFQQDSLLSKTSQNKKAELNLKERDLTDSLTRLKQVNEDIRYEIKSDSVLFVDLTAKKNKTIELKKEHTLLTGELNDKENQLKALEQNVASLKIYSKDLEVLKNEKSTVEGLMKDIDIQYNKANADLKSFNTKLSTLSDERNIFSYFNKQKIDKIKNQKSSVLSQLNCNSQRSVQVEGYYTEIQQLISTGLVDKELNDIYNSIINHEEVCQLIIEAKNALQQKYDENRIENLLVKMKKQSTSLSNVQKTKDLLEQYCKKSRLAYAYINEASKQNKKLLVEYIDVVLEEFNNYPFLKSELLKYRNTQTNSLESITCK